jgi:excisionase family DNA binding protein
MNSAPAITQDGGVVVQGDALPLLYRAVLALAARHNRDGITPSPLLHELRAALFRATTMSPTRHQLANALASSSCCGGQDPSDLISVAEAAELQRLSKRQVQRLAANPGGLDGVRIGRTWMLAKAPVLTLAEQRKAAK